MTEPEEVARIRAYLEQHRATYDREALRRKLVAEGSTPEAVDQAMTEAYGSADNASGPPVFGGQPRLYYLLIISILVVKVLVLPALLKYVYEAKGWWPPWAPPYQSILLLTPVELLVAAVLTRFAVPDWVSQAMFRAEVLYVVLLPVWVGVCTVVLQPPLFG